MLKAICLGVLFSAANALTLFYESGQTQFTALKMPFGARTRAMGDAGAASADDGGYASLNPALLSRFKEDGVFLEHANLYQDRWAEYLNATLVWPLFNLGISLEYFDHGRAPVTTDGSDYDEENTFGSYAAAAMLTASMRWKNLDWGLTVKGLRETVWYESSNGAALDLGVATKTALPGLSLGASAMNLGYLGAMVSVRYPLTQVFRAGAAYKTIVGDNFGLEGAADLNLSNDGKFTLPAGLEVKKSALALRTGYLLFHDTRGFSAGAGVEAGNFRFDYSYVHYKDNLTDNGQPHFFSLQITL